MNDIVSKDNVAIEDLIYEIRGKKVMLDSDLAKQYKVETKVLMQAVKRNIERFPDNFMFQLTNREYDDLRSQIVTSKVRGGRRYNPYVFTEQGVAMLSGLLHSKTAIQTSINIINTFVKMRHFIKDSLLEQKYINNLVIEHDERLKIIEEAFDKLEEKRNVNEIYYNGQIYDAYSKIKDIFKNATKKLIIVDSYADKTLLDIIKTLNVDVIIITKKDNLLTLQDIEKYNKQYHNLKVIFNNSFHDRYFIIDNKTMYHCGASINRIGYKTFSINLIGDKEAFKSLLDKVNTII
ncbi:MAG: ORF6N domain-containing protein [Bacilli bacterium]|nr:ORF6N domain-containing protein [Bacilli bacterium]